MTFGIFDAMKKMIPPRYNVKDDKGNKLLDHPYKPWTKVPPENQQAADDAYRAFKMFENVKEWTMVSMPLMWTAALFAGALPFMNQDRVDILIAGVSVAWMVGSAKYANGYMKSPADRGTGFKIRMLATLGFLAISTISIGYTFLQRFNIVA